MYTNDNDSPISGNDPAEKKGGGRKTRLSLAAIVLVVAVGGCAIGLGIGAGYAAFNSHWGGRPQTSAGAGGVAVPGFVSHIFNDVESSVVSISVLVQNTDSFNQVQTGQGSGSGVVFKEDNDYIYIVTNYHVVEGAKKCTISFDDRTRVAANYVGGYPNADIAVIKAGRSDLTAAGITNYTVAVFADSGNVHVGDAAIAIGNAAGGGKSATFGIVSALGRQLAGDGGQPINFLQTDAAINPGNSGGALVSADGRIIGINTAKLVASGIEGIGFAIPSNCAVGLIDQIMSPEWSKNAEPTFGVLTLDIPQSVRDQYNLPATGVFVYSVTEGSTAALMGIRAGDIITTFNGSDVATGAQLADDIAGTKVGDTVTAIIFRMPRAGDPAQTLTLSGTMQSVLSGSNF